VPVTLTVSAAADLTLALKEIGAMVTVHIYRCARMGWWS
jgi:hypothetical protein